MRYFYLILFVFASALNAESQFWYGPKVGGRLISTVYQDESYKDDFKVPAVFDMEAGVVLNYVADDFFSAQVELNYERFTKSVKDISGEISVNSRTSNHFLSVPLMLRASLSTGPVHYYLSGGPKLSFWLGGNGRLDLEELTEFNREPLDYRIVFRKNNGGLDERRYVADANRIQYALTAGGGIFLDLRTSGRLMLDLRYNFGHSNMAFNREDNDFSSWDSYYENFEYRSNVLTASVAYLFNYDVQLRKKGMSTNPGARRKKIDKKGKTPIEKK